MLFYVSSWIVLIIASWLVGGGVLRLAHISCFDNLGDRLIATIWLGLLAIAISLLGLSIILALSPITAMVLAVILMAVLGSVKGLCADMTMLLQRPTRIAFLGLACLAVSCALDATRPVEAYDTGLYHYQLTRWLREYGTVPGLALIHSRFGFSSSWFALAAPFDSGVFEARISGLLGGLALFLSLVHFVLAFARIVEHRDTRADWFLVGGYPLIFLICLSWSFEVSLSPDLPAWILTLLTAWFFLLSMPDPRLRLAAYSSLPSRDSSILSLLIAIAAATIKLSAAPLVAAAILFFYRNSTAKWSARLLGVSLASLIAVPFLMANSVSSGCPLYPNGLLCLQVPWGIGKATAQVIAAGIGDWARRGGTAVVGAGAWEWVFPWLSHADRLVLLSMCILCLLGFVAVCGWRRNRAFLWVLGVAVSGTVFVFMTAPNPRFAAGFLAIYPALLFSAIGPDINSFVHLRMITWSRSSSLVCLLGLGALLVLHDGVNEVELKRKLNSFGNPHSQVYQYFFTRVLLPPRLPKFPGDVVILKNRRFDRLSTLDLVTEQANGFEYERPLHGDQCWGAMLPCVPSSLADDIRLRRPTAGISSGFSRSAGVALERQR